MEKKHWLLIALVAVVVGLFVFRPKTFSMTGKMVDKNVNAQMRDDGMWTSNVDPIFPVNVNPYKIGYGPIAFLNTFQG